MRLIVSAVAAALLAAALSTSAFAQEVTAEQVQSATVAIEAAGLSDDAYKNLWCGAAFGMVKETLTPEGDPADVAMLDKLQSAVFEKAAAELITAGVAKEDFEALAGNFYYLAVSQTTAEGGVADFTREECMAAAE